MSIPKLAGGGACLAIGLLLAGCADTAKQEESTEETSPTEETVTEDIPIPKDVKPGNPVVVMETTMGKIVLELYAEEAPKSVENFLTYVEDGFYDGTIFHRVVPRFVIQGGGFTPDMVEKPTRDAIENEAANGLKNVRGSLAMARTSDPHSASAQFYINTRDNAALDYRGANPRDYGYAVFGRVAGGMEVVDQIEAVPTTTKGPYEGVPVEPVVIRSARLKTE
ncbi:MAG: peptidylprolyl isomerase [Acidobacteriota bacterium]